MEKIVKSAKLWFLSNWELAVCGSTDAARFMRIKPSTLKTRIARGQALARRTPNNVRDTIEFTAFQLTYNVLQDAVSRHNYPLRGLETGNCEEIRQWCRILWENSIKDSAAVRLLAREDHSRVDYFEGGDVKLGDEPEFVIPIGAMVTRMAVDLYMRKMAGSLEGYGDLEADP